MRLLLAAAVAVVLAPTVVALPERWAGDERIVFPSALAGRTAIWSVGAGGGGLRKLTAPGARRPRCYCRGGDYDGHPVWSHDGRWIAFTRGAGLFLVDAKGGRLHRVAAPGGAEDYDPTWSARGRLAFVRDRRAHGRDVYEILSTDPAGLQERLLAGPQPLPFDDLAWSPDGRSLAYTSRYSDPRDGIKVGLFVLSEGGGRPRFLLWAFSLAGPSWSPDGRRISFVANEPGSLPYDPYRLFTVTVHGRRIVQLTHEVGDRIADLAPRWSPDGSRIVFTRMVVDRPTVVSLRPDGSGQRVLADDGQGAAWSPDGHELVYVANVHDRRRPLTLSVMTARGVAKRDLVRLHRPQDGFDLSAQSWRPS